MRMESDVGTPEGQQQQPASTAASRERGQEAQEQADSGEERERRVLEERLREREREVQEEREAQLQVLAPCSLRTRSAECGCSRAADCRLGGSLLLAALKQPRVCAGLSRRLEAVCPPPRCAGSASLTWLRLPAFPSGRRRKSSSSFSCRRRKASKQKASKQRAASLRAAESPAVRRYEEPC